MSTCEDIRGDLKQFVKRSECMKLTNLCFEFWKHQYNHMEAFINLVKTVGWMNSMCDQPVSYSTPVVSKLDLDFDSNIKIGFTTQQDYRIMESYHILVDDRQSRKKRRVSLRLPTKRRDRRKTQVSTFVNFIHQKDAFLAMRVIEKMISIQAPIYTVHDNFITNAYTADLLPKFYLRVIKDMGPPLRVVNQFLLDNLLLDIDDVDLEPAKLKMRKPYKTQFFPKTILRKLSNSKKRK